VRIIILGAGEVGTHIAASLSREGHDLVVIERDAEKVALMQKSMDVLAVKGDGCNPSVLKKHQVGDADLFFAVSNSDSSNLLAALTARRMGARTAVVRVGNPALGKNPLVRADDELRLLYPEQLVAEEIFCLTQVPGTGKARFFGEGKLVLLQARPSISAKIYGKPIKELQGPDNWILTGIHRATGTVIPRGDTLLRPGDLLYSVGPAEAISSYLESIGVESRPTRRVVIAGAGQVGATLAKQLIHAKIEVAIIQRGEKRAADIAAEIPEALVIRGDATDSGILNEAGIEDADYFVSATQSDEVNLLASLLARESGARSVVALYNRPEFLNLMLAVRIDIPLSPRMMTAGTILRMVHRSEIVSMDLVEGGDAEIVEFEVPPGARALKAPLSALKFPRNAIIGTVLRGEQMFVPGGDFTFREGDRTLVFTLSKALPDLERMFRGR